MYISQQLIKHTCMAGDIAHGIIIDFGPLSIKCQRYNYVTYIHVTCHICNCITWCVFALTWCVYDQF